MIQKKSLKDAIQNPEIISVVGGLLPEATSKNKGLMTSSIYSKVSSLIIVGTSDTKPYIEITFSGKWCGVIAVVKNNYEPQLLFAGMPDYGGGSPQLKQIGGNFSNTKYYYNTTNKNKILIENIYAWGEVSCLAMTGKVESIIALESSSIDLSGYTNIKPQ